SHGDRLAALVVVASPGVGILCFAVWGISGHECVTPGGAGIDVAGDVNKVRIDGHVEPGAEPGSADLFPQQVAAAVELDEDDVLLGAGIGWTLVTWSSAMRAVVAAERARGIDA